MARRTSVDLLRLNVDLVWGGGERLAGLMGRPLRDFIVPIGDGTMPVITIPGFLSGEYNLKRLNRFLTTHGFPAASWGRGRNLGPRDKTLFEHVEEMEEELGAAIRDTAQRFEHRVALVGQSLGGVYARELGRRLPDCVDRVITLGSPAMHPDRLDELNQFMRYLGRRVSGRRLAELSSQKGSMHWEKDDPPLPYVAVYSPTDRVVPPSLAAIPQEIVDHAAFRCPRENIRIVCSHSGMSVNPFVILAILDRLVQDHDEWVPFDPGRYFHGAMSHWPTPYAHHDQGNVLGAG